MSLSPVQVKSLWACAAQLRRAAGLSQEEMREHLYAFAREEAGKDSLRALTPVQASRVSARLGEVRKRFPATRKRRAPGVPAGMPSKEQTKAIRLLQGALGWSDRDLGVWMRGHMKRTTGGMPWPQTAAEAVHCHEGLEQQMWRSEEYSPERLSARARDLLNADIELSPFEVALCRDLVAKGGRLGQGSTAPRWKPAAKLAEIERVRGRRGAA